MKVIVLGAGVIGVTSAWYLCRAGHEVTVIEREPGPALGTSFANGGQVSASHAMPWANPRAPLEILRWLARADAPLKFRPRLDWRQWAWGARFLCECTAPRARANARRILGLARSSLAELAALRSETGIAYDARTDGILSFYLDERAFDAARAEAEWVSREGLARLPRTAAECVAIEPALRGIAPRLAGGGVRAGRRVGRCEPLHARACVALRSRRRRVSLPLRAARNPRGRGTHRGRRDPRRGG